MPQCPPQPDDFKLGFEKAAQTLKHNPVIIGKQDPDFFHMAFPFSNLFRISLYKAL
jgi:hypothetical protein